MKFGPNRLAIALQNAVHHRILREVALHPLAQPLRAIEGGCSIVKGRRDCSSQRGCIAGGNQLSGVFEDFRDAADPGCDRRHALTSRQP